MLSITFRVSAYLKYFQLMFTIIFQYFYFFLETVSVRHAHTDIKVPDFSDYRNDITNNPNQSTKELDDEKKTFSYISTFGNLYLQKLMNSK
jgi:hypothetical protein